MAGVSTSGQPPNPARDDLAFSLALRSLDSWPSQHPPVGGNWCISISCHRASVEHEMWLPSLTAVRLMELTVVTPPVVTLQLRIATPRQGKSTRTAGTTRRCFVRTDRWRPTPQQSRRPRRLRFRRSTTSCQRTRIRNPYPRTESVRISAHAPRMRLNVCWRFASLVVASMHSEMVRSQSGSTSGSRLTVLLALSHINTLIAIYYQDSDLPQMGRYCFGHRSCS